MRKEKKRKTSNSAVKQENDNRTPCILLFLYAVEIVSQRLFTLTSKNYQRCGEVGRTEGQARVMDTKMARLYSV